MSEYWKSTPKYWCKHCNAYVKDTPFERKQHESTAKHQGNLKRFLRGIQNDHERSEREKDKVKAEVERLNKVVGSSSPVTPAVNKQPTIRKTANGPLSAADQKKQWAQLADMGIQVPEGFKAEMALPGEWQKVAERSVEDTIKEEALSTGIRKRKYEGQEEEEEAGETVARRGWGSTTRRYPGQGQSDLDDLLSVSVLKKEKNSTSKVKSEPPGEPAIRVAESRPVTKPEPNSDADECEHQQNTAGIPKQVHAEGSVKDEPEESNEIPTLPVTSELLDVPVFKKRKAKAK